MHPRPSATKEAFHRIMRDPRVIFDRIYYSIRGIRVIELKNKYENDSGTLAALSQLAVQQAGGIEHEDLSCLVGTEEDADTKELGALFAHYGSDKSTKHDYYRLYASLLKNKRNQPINILEIGLGTNNVNVSSNMGKDGKPGASLRAFRDWAPNASVYGADVDEGCLFSEERIETFFVDQTRTDTLDALASNFAPHSFDLIIDDGLHNTWANVNMLTVALGLLKPGGVFVVEDIVDKYVYTWKTVAALLKGGYTCRLLQAKAESVFIVTRA